MIGGLVRLSEWITGLMLAVIAGDKFVQIIRDLDDPAGRGARQTKAASVRSWF